MIKKIILLLLFVTAACGSLNAQGMYVTGYYPVWSLGTSPAGQSNAMYPDQMNWNGLTHVIHFNVQIDQTPPYWHPATSTTLGTPFVDSLELFYGYSWRSNSTSYKMIDSLRTYAHRYGVKLILSIGGTWGPGAAAMSFITLDSLRTTVMAKAVVAFAVRNGYDGIETNWEPPSSDVQAARLIRILKREMTRSMGPNADLLVTACPDHCGPTYLSVQDSVQQFLITAYDMKRPSESGLGAPDIVGFDAPLHPPAAAQFPLLNYWNNNYDGIQAGRVNWSGANEMIARGFNRAKLVQVFPGFAYVFRGNTAPEQATAGYQQYLYNIDAQIALSRGGTRHWENSAKVPWISGTATQAIGWQVPQGSTFYITYDDTASIREKVIWSKGLNLGGVGIYELQSAWNAGAPPGQRDPLVRTMVSAANNPPPAPVPTGTFNASPSSLPLGGGTVTLSWTSSNAQSASIDQGIGAVALNGSRNVAVTATTSFHLTLTNANGNNVYTATVDVALPPPPPPSAPVLATPANGATGIATSPLLTWNASPGATSYRIQVSTNAGFTTTVVDQSNITTPSHVPSSVLALNTIYYWRVSATNGGGTSPYASPWSFTTTASSLSGPVACYSFDQGSGTTLSDLSGNNNNGTLQSGPSWVTGKYGGGLSFDGVGAYVSVLATSALPAANAAKSISVWYKVASNPLGAQQLVVLQNAGSSSSQLDFRDNTIRAAQWGGGAVVAGATPAANAWHHAAYTFDGTNNRLYLDGILVNSSTSAPQTGTSDQMYLGTYSGLSELFAGQLDDLRIYNRAQAQAEIQADMNTPLGVILPAGTFSATPDSLPAGGGIVTLSWTSTNAQTASIDNGIGNVSLSGSRQATVGSSTAFTLTLANQSGSRQYSAAVDVALPGGQGQQDITSQGTPIALITNPTGGGNHNIEVIRDGVTPPVGSTNVLEQYDTFTDGSARPFEWIGYQFASGRSFSGILYQEGLDNQWGGGFTPLQVQVLTGGVWANVQNLQSIPPYTGANALNYETFQVSFSPIAGDAIRIAGAPTGSAHYIGVGELRVFEQQSGTLPSAPQLAVPLNGAMNQPATVVLRWNRVASVTGYHLQVSMDSLFSSMVINDAQLTDTLRQVSGLATSSRFFWRVSSRVAGGEGNFSAAWSFRTVVMAPSIPILVSPVSGSISQPVSVPVRWRQASGASSYHVQVSTTSSFTAIVVNDSSVVDTMRQVSGLLNQTKYYWRVRSRNGGGYSSFAGTWNFTTIVNAPGIPVLTAPLNNAINQGLTPTLRWTRPAGATTFTLQVSRDSIFSTMVRNESTLTNTSRQINGLVYLTKYFWRVRAQNAVGVSQFSSASVFTTKKSRTDVTSNASLATLIVQPTGNGNPNREVMRDNVTPPEGGINPMDQFDTFTGSTSQQFDWVGYSFNSTHRFSNLEFQEGVESDSGGWFASLTVQVRVNGNWIPVQSLATTPEYAPNNGVNFEMYELNFDPVLGDAIRIAGVPGGIYTYISVAELRVMDDDSSVTDVKGQQIPKTYSLDQNYPNPFNPTTIISFNMPEQGYATLTVYDMLGGKVATLVDGFTHAGRNQVEFNANNLANGVYMYILKSNSFRDTKKMMLLK